MQTAFREAFILGNQPVAIDPKAKRIKFAPSIAKKSPEDVVVVEKSCVISPSSTSSSESSSCVASSNSSRENAALHKDTQHHVKKTTVDTKKLNYQVKYRRTTRRVTSKRDNMDRFFDQLRHIELKELMPAICGTENCKKLKKEHHDVFLGIKTVAEELIQNRKMLTETELRRRADRIFGKKTDEVRLSDFKEFLYSILDDVFVLKQNNTFGSAIPLKWRRINMYIGASVCTPIFAEATNIETLYDNSMLGRGTSGVFGALDIANAVKFPMREEIRERMLRLTKLLVCDLIRTVLKSEVCGDENDKNTYISKYYYDGEFDIPEKSKSPNEPEVADSGFFASQNPIQFFDEVSEMEESHWVHFDQKGEKTDPTTADYAEIFETNDLAQQHFPIVRETVLRTVPASVKMTIEQKRKML